MENESDKIVQHIPKNYFSIFASQVTQMITILTDPNTSYLQSVAAIHNLNKLVFRLDYQQILDVLPLFINNETFIDKLISIAMEGKPCVYQVIRFLSVLTMNPYGRKRLLKMNFIPIIFALLKTNQYSLRIECFLVLQTMLTTNDTTFLREFGTYVRRGSIEMMISWMKNGSEEAVIVGRRVLACVAMTPEGREILQKYQSNMKNTSQMSQTEKKIQISKYKNAPSTELQSSQIASIMMRSQDRANKDSPKGNVSFNLNDRINSRENHQDVKKTVSSKPTKSTSSRPNSMYRLTKK